MTIPPHPPLFTGTPHSPFPSPSLHSFSSQQPMLDPITELANNHVHEFSPAGHINDSYDSRRTMNYGAKARKIAQNYENYRDFNGGGVQFRPDHMEDESGVCSPPLWKTSPLQLQHTQNNYRYLSPTARAQAIARGQWELMEMVKNMPESSYELSLRDLVDQTKVGAQEECLVEEKKFVSESVSQRLKVMREDSKKNEKKVKMMRSGSIDNRGLFLKMVFPISLGSKKKKNSATNNFAKVSPKPEASEKSSKGVDKDWWKKRFSTSFDSENSGTSSNNSGSTGSSGSSGSNSCRRNSSGRKRSDFFPGCCSFFCTKKSKSGK
ncbi:hypothetical protein F0562_027832 [Nyssa sinensis]|uniref:Uncharacterized protein n=1 Tax=Nyssa sinensis TaxID=561372 RepID=A0A5J5B519_9ASTE|nr:hypothetical protein F0562_027832 [Nyssa sinensis]